LPVAEYIGPETFADPTSAAVRTDGDGGFAPRLARRWSWSPDSLSIAFEIIEELAGSPGGAAKGCKAVDAFKASAEPLFNAYCSTCHGGGDAGAQAAVDMSGLMKDSAAACGQILNRVSLETPEKSQVFLMTDPASGAAHKFKFGQDEGAFKAFKEAVSAWIQAEQ